MEIKVLGSGCPRCKQAEKVVREVLAETGVNASVEKVTDIKTIAEFGVFGTPAVVVDGNVKCVGKIPSKEDIKKWVSIALCLVLLYFSPIQLQREETEHGKQMLCSEQ